MNTEKLLSEIIGLNETIISLFEKIDSLKGDLKKNNEEMEKLRFRLSELEEAIK
jgi:peptidoglycan hydrolase CwlO-like protein